MTPFEKWFLNDYPKKLKEVKEEPGVFSAPATSIETASWDHKAAFLIWNLLGRPGDSWTV